MHLFGIACKRDVNDMRERRLSNVLELPAAERRSATPTTGRPRVRSRRTQHDVDAVEQAIAIAAA